MDTTHFKQRFAVLVLMDSLSLKPIYFRFIPAEKNQYYFDAISALIEKGIKIQSIFRQMKAKLAPHQGLTDEHKIMFIKDFICQKELKIKP